MPTVTGQSRHEMWSYARRSREVWASVATEAGIPVQHKGLLLTVRRPEAVALLEAFLKTDMGQDCRMMDAAEVRRRHPAFEASDLLAALWSPHELRVESCDAIPRLAAICGRNEAATASAL